MPEPAPLLDTDPEIVGRYRLEGRLGAGGQGTVYLGEDENKRRTAIKVLHPHLITHEAARTRFLAEVEIAKRVAPFCTAQVLDSGVVNSQPYIVSEFVDGPSLQMSVKDGDGPRGEAALERLAINTVTALAGIHQGGVVHRDFKPGNVLLGPDGPVVIDFGISRALDLSMSLTSSQVVGTPGYMAPEHIDGETAGPEADMFGWGATMVFAATGRRAFTGTSASAVAMAVLHREPDLDGLEGDLGEVVRACLEKDPAKRPTATEVGDRLRALRPPQTTPPPPPDNTEPPQEPPATAQPDPPPPSPKRRRLQIAAVVITILAIIAITFSLVTESEKDNASRSPRDFSTNATGNRYASTPQSTRSSPSPDRTRTASSKPSVRQPPNGTQDGSDPRPSTTKKPSDAGPRTLGTLTTQDQANYCKARGYRYSAPFGDQVACSNSTDGSGDGEVADATTVCRWKHSGRSNVHADGRTCISDP